MASQDFQENFFQCSICVERFTNPKVLRCQHSFCKECIHLHILQEVRKFPGRRGIPCPLCRTFTETDTTIQPDQWAGHLVTNFTLVNMMDTFEKKSHVSKCDTHGKHVEYMCRTHQMKICSDCAVFEHRSCDIVASAALEKHEQLFVDLTDKLVLMNSLQERFSKGIATLNEDKEAMERTITDHFLQIKQRLQSAEEDQLNLLKCKFEYELTDLNKSAEKCTVLKNKSEEILQDLKSCDGSPKEIEECVSKAESAKVLVGNEIKDLNRKGITLISLKSKSYLDERVHKLSEVLGEVLVNLSGNDQFQHAEETSNLPTQVALPLVLGQNVPIQHVHYPGMLEYPLGQQVAYPLCPMPPGGIQQVFSSNPFSSSSTDHEMNLPSDNPGALSSLTIQNTFDARQPSDKMHCWITGAQYLTNGNIVLADRNNKKVKLFSSNFFCVAAITTHTYPFDVTQTCRGDVAVTIPKDNLISFYNPESLLVSNTFINTEQPCMGIVCIRDKLFVCCDTTWSRLGCIKVYDGFNNLLRRIEKDNFGKDMVSVTDYIGHCPSTESLIFKRGGFSRECIHCTSQTGDVIWKAKVPSWKDLPVGMVGINGGAIVSMGCLTWVCNEERDKWKKLTEIGDIAGPCALALDHSKTKLLVTQADAISNCRENDVVKIFTINYTQSD